MEKVIAMLEEIKESIINAYELRTGLSRTKISHLMDSESWFNAKKAVELGFADKVLFEEDSSKGATDSYTYSRITTNNQLVVKLQAKLGQKKSTHTIPINQLEKRLNLLK